MESFDKSMFKTEIINEPKNIVNTIMELSELLSESNREILEIEEMNFLEKILSKDINKFSKILIKQNDAMCTFLNVVQGLVFVNMTNITVMDEVLSKLSDCSGKNNEYIDLAKNYIESAINISKKSTRMLNNHENLLNDLKIKMLKKNNLDEEQNDLIEQLNREIDYKKRLDEEQNLKIDDLFEIIDSKNQIDREQDSSIKKIIELLKSKNKIDKEQSRQIELMKNIIFLQNEKIRIIEEKLNSH